MKITITSICFAFSTFVLSGCSTTYRDPKLNNAASSSFAIFDPYGPKESFGQPWSEVGAVDGVKRPIGIFKRYELSPGIHSITFFLSAPGFTSKTITRTFEAKAEKRYVADFGADFKAMRWWVRILDESTQNPVDY